MQIPYQCVDCHFWPGESFEEQTYFLAERLQSCKMRGNVTIHSLSRQHKHDGPTHAVYIHTHTGMHERGATFPCAQPRELGCPGRCARAHTHTSLSIPFPPMPLMQVPTVMTSARQQHQQGTQACNSSVRVCAGVYFDGLANLICAAGSG
jgi:hypothetical protein